MAPKVRSNEERFWALVEVGEDDECWLWTGSVDKDGYGWFSWRLGPKKHRNINAARYSLMMKLNNYDLPTELMTCHECPNKHCVNPNHLREDDAAGNAADMISAGTLVQGEKHYCSKLTDAQRKEILELYSKPHNPYGWNIMIGKKYGVDKQIVRRLVAGLTAKHLQ